MKTKAVSDNFRIFVTIKLKDGSTYVSNQALVDGKINFGEDFEVIIKDADEEDINFS